MYKEYDLAVVIPVRLGSSRVSHKALLPVGEEGISLLAWKIRQVKKVLPAHQIYVSTEAAQLKEIALAEGVKVHERDPYLCDGHKATFSEVIVGVVKDIPHEHIAWVTCVVPLMSPKEYLQGFTEYNKQVLGNDAKHDSLVSVNLLKEYLWDDNGPINYSPTKNHTVSQDLPDTYRVTNGLYMASKKLMLDKEYILGTNPYKSTVSKIAGIDIDEYEDYEIARGLENFYCQNASVSERSRHIFLDFDGVMFDSVKEAYAIAMLTTNQINCLAELDLNAVHAQRFFKQRYLIGPAWNYYYLLQAIDRDRDPIFAQYLPEQPSVEALEFMQEFFAMRNVIRKNFADDWLKLNSMFEGAQHFITLLNQHSNISIVTTKDAATVKYLLNHYNISREVQIFDNSDYAKFGCKSYLIDDYIRKSNIDRAILVEDSKKHLDKCVWVEGLSTLYAQWGYVSPSDKQDNMQDVLNQLTCFLNE